MTVLFSATNGTSIVMAADSAITNVFDDHEEYQKGQKTWAQPGIGCVMTWGEMTGGQFRRLRECLDRSQFDAGQQCVHDLAQAVFQYLTDCYRPCQVGWGDVGYHVGGFDHEAKPCLYHIFWGLRSSENAQSETRSYVSETKTAPPGKVQVLFSGRNDLARVAVQAVVDQYHLGGPLRLNPGTEVGLTQFADFAVRFAAELTPQVGPPFVIRVLRYGSPVLQITNDRFRPIDVGHVQRELGAHLSSGLA